jgi:predicted membrane-bound spermidine synthase
MKDMPKSLLAGVGFIALATLLLEVNITRIFSVTLWYYFGFLAISLALLGIAAAGVLCYVFAKRLIGHNYAKHLIRFSVLFALFTPLAIYFHLNMDLSRFSLFSTGFYLILGVQLLLLFISFFLAAMCITIALFRYSAKISTIYFSDLVGASLGCLIVVPLLFHFSAPSITFVASIFACLAALAFSIELKLRWVKVLVGVLAVIFIALLLTNDRWGLLKVVTIKSYSADTPQEREINKVFEKWSPVSRVAVFAPRNKTYEDQKYQTMRVTNDAGAPTLLYRFDGDYSKVGYLKADSRQIVHHLKPNADVLIIGSGGGVDVFSSLLFNPKKITSVEINPVIGKLVTEIYADYIGRIFEDPRVTLHINEGRNFVAGSKDLYDIIQITMIDSWAAAASGAYLFNENTLYTYEAVRDYYTHLKEDGVLSITRYFYWDEALRLSNIFIQYLIDNGVDDIEKRLIVVVESERKYRRATVLLKKGVFIPDEISAAVNTAKQYGYSVVYAPQTSKENLDSSANSNTFRTLIDPKAYSQKSREDFIKSYPKNINPPTDNRPFFFFMRYFRDIFRSDPEDHAARRIALPLLYGMFISFGVIGILTIFLPLYLSRSAEIRRIQYRLHSLIYFVGLGIGFMLIEISLIQRLTVFLGHPTYSFVVVLATLLLSSGIGSMVSGIWAPGSAPRKLLTVLVIILGIILIYILFLYDSFTAFMWLSKPVRILISVVLIIPPGFFMGMCFPMGIQIVRKFHEHLVPWAWGVNGAFSVFASIFSLVIALNFGFKAMMGVGLAFYGVAYIVTYTLRKSVE